MCFYMQMLCQTCNAVHKKNVVVIFQHEQEPKLKNKISDKTKNALFTLFQWVLSWYQQWMTLCCVAPISWLNPKMDLSCLHHPVLQKDKRGASLWSTVHQDTRKKYY